MPMERFTGLWIRERLFRLDQIYVWDETTRLSFKIVSVLRAPRDSSQDGENQEGVLTSSLV